MNVSAKIFEIVCLRAAFLTFVAEKSSRQNKMVSLNGSEQFDTFRFSVICFFKEAHLISGCLYWSFSFQESPDCWRILWGLVRLSNNSSSTNSVWSSVKKS